MGGIKAKITILGCGGSGGTPLATGYWGLCDPSEPKNTRTRASIAIRTEKTCVVIDTGPDFRLQTLRENIDRIDAVFYTHFHGDHVNGIDDLRYVAIKRRINGEEGYQIPVYMDQTTYDDLKIRFGYMFSESPDGLYQPLLDVHIIDENMSNIIIGDITLQPFVQTHGRGRSLGYKIGDVGYSTDVSDFDKNSLNALQGIKTWIIDCGQYDADETTVHLNYKQVLEWNDVIGADKLYLTHLTPRADYMTVNNETDGNVECAFDGMKLITEM